MTAEKVRAGIVAQVAALNQLGYATQSIFVDLGETAEAVITKLLAERRVGCVVLGTGVRLPPENFILFETLLSVVHANAPQAKLAFNTGPADTAAAVQRWI